MRFAAGSAAMLATGCGAPPVPAPSSPAPPEVVVTEPSESEPEDPSDPPPSVPRSATPKLVVAQAERAVPVDDGDEVALAKAPFALRFELGHYDGPGRRHFNARVVGDTQPLAIGFGPALHQDRQMHPFGPATGFAGEAGGYRRFVLGADGSHYLFFDPDEPEESRVRRLEPRGDDRSWVEFRVSTVFEPEGASWEMNEFPHSRLYLAVFIDEDLDGVVELGELFRIRLSFA